MTRVIFRKFEDEITACFPDDMSCYAHIGQHSEFSREWFNETRPAKPREYAALKRELEGAPYEYTLEVLTEWPSVSYLDAGRIIGAARKPYSIAAQRRQLTGYEPKLASDIEVKLDDNRTRRVWIANYGNAGSAYVLVKGQRLFLDSDCEYRIEKLWPFGIDLDAHLLDSFTRAYIACALWTSNDESRDDGGDPLDRNYSFGDFAQSALADAFFDCWKFQYQNAETLSKAYESEVYIQGKQYDSVNAGYDFWLTRNGHGAGFWDRGFTDEIGDSLTKACEAFGEVNAFLGDNKQIYFG